MVVTVAAVAASVVLAALIVLPAMRAGGSVIGSWVLGLQAGGVTVAGAIIIGAAIRSEQLLDQPPDAEQAASLLRLSALDGRDSGFFNLIVVVTLVLGGLLVALLVLAARFAADTDPVERVLAAGLLGAGGARLGRRAGCSSPSGSATRVRAAGARAAGARGRDRGGLAADARADLAAHG